jgi:tRNA uridine 5-carbamoylmethylation protein Kti12
MMNGQIDIIIIRGAPASGKSQTAKSLAKYFTKGVRIEIDTIRSMVISVDWTNQEEHIKILGLSTKLINDFRNLTLSPVIVVDTFSGDKVKSFIKQLMELDETLSIKVFGLYTTDIELEKRINARKGNEFKDLSICKKINTDVLKFKYVNEIQIDTTLSTPEQTAKIIFENINLNQ